MCVVVFPQCYWHSVEFGLCYEDGQPKAYGAGLLSSFGELEYACGNYDTRNCSKTSLGTVASTGTVLPTPEFKVWDPEVASQQEFPITTYQPIYFVTPSIRTALEQMQNFCNTMIHRPFYAIYNPVTEMIETDRPVQRTKGVPF
jgi:phenylalanine-4-hydroxylase